MVSESKRPSEADRRQEERISAKLEVRFEARSEAAKALKAYSVNLSAGGLCLRTKRVYPVGASLQLTLNVGGETFELEAAVAWARDEAIGVRFVNVRPDDKERLRRVVAEFHEARPRAN